MIDEREYMADLLYEAQYRHMSVEETVDLLQDHGVICPPCKVGDTVFMLDRRVVPVKVIGLEFYSDGANIYTEFLQIPMCKWRGPIDSIGKYIFLTSEAAEQALKERERR